MAELPLIILDASVGVKWVLRLPDEDHTDQAAQVLADFDQGRIRLLTTEYFRAEVGHALLKAVRRDRITSQQGADSLDMVNSWDVPVFRHSGVLAAGWRLAHRYGCSFYDAGYLALAAMISAPFLHTDGKLRNALAGRFPGELWLPDYAADNRPS